MLYINRKVRVLIVGQYKSEQNVLCGATRHYACLYTAQGSILFLAQTYYTVDEKTSLLFVVNPTSSVHFGHIQSRTMLLFFRADSVSYQSAISMQTYL